MAYPKPRRPWLEHGPAMVLTAIRSYGSVSGTNSLSLAEVVADGRLGGAVAEVALVVGGSLCFFLLRAMTSRSEVANTSEGIRLGGAR